MLRTVFSTSAAEQYEEIMFSLYGTRIRMRLLPGSRAGSRAGAGTALYHERRLAGELCMDLHAMPTSVSFDVPPLPSLLVSDITTGRVRVDHAHGSGRFSAGDVWVLAQPGLPYLSQAHGVAGRVTVLSPALLRDVAGLDDDHRAPLRLLRSYAPAAPARAALWRATSDHAWHLLDKGAAVSTVLMRDAAVRLLAAVALDAFPSTYTCHDPLRPGPGHAGDATVRRAVDFIHAHADRPLTLSETAAAVRTSSGQLLAAFRRRLGTTPAGYVRRVRLARVHTDLRAADPGTGATVAGIATRWGFRCTDRFETGYRVAFGRSPSRTLYD
ncbi:helix-turn-helix domain-containing protein [Streptomyces poonensis]|uniref:helix-turn-helix domain-containing protein n=1 Tax=Streptomyces poonensis TaxID=68255 RepID=UPI001671EDA4|nr:AraC family transcriptional regulator [Streptomyces poonensis]